MASANPSCDTLPQSDEVTLAVAPDKQVHDLPNRCVRCGAPSTLILTVQHKGITAPFPFCAKHGKPPGGTWKGTVGMILMVLVTIVVSTALRSGLIMIIVGVTAAAVTGFVRGAVQQRLFRGIELEVIDEGRFVVLRGCSSAFADAVCEKQRDLAVRRAVSLFRDGESRTVVEAALVKEGWSPEDAAEIAAEASQAPAEDPGNQFVFE